MAEQEPSDKNWKLQRYGRKDYSELVDFPVEIVGRDGMVRRYTFDDSIRLYQRRITFAPVRYPDGELISAEVEHCRSRIEQLRRSYFYRFGWGTPEGESGPEDAFGELAGEVAAFLCRVLRCDERPDVRFQAVSPEVEGCSTWYVTPHGSAGSFLLYVARFSLPQQSVPQQSVTQQSLPQPKGVGSGASATPMPARLGDNGDARERFFAQLKALEHVGQGGGDVERLVAFHHTVDCGFVLTAQGEVSIEVRDDGLDDGVDYAPTPWEETLELIRRGEYERALGRCRVITREQPWHLQAYRATAMLGVFNGDIVHAEEAAMLGVRYFPDDALLHYYLGLARLRQSDGTRGEASLRRAVALAPGMVTARTLLVVHLLRRRDYREASELLRARHGIKPDDTRGDQALDLLERWLRWRQFVLLGSVIVVLLGAALLPLVGWLGLLPVLAGVGGAVIGWFALRAQVDVIVRRQRLEEIGQGLRRLTRRPAAARRRLI